MAVLASITNCCTNIIGNGSTFSICRTCRAGGLAPHAVSYRALPLCLAAQLDQRTAASGKFAPPTDQHRWRNGYLFDLHALAGR